MGLDQTLSWYGKPSKDAVNRLYHKNISDIGTNGMSYVEFDDREIEERYKYIKKYMIPCEIYRNTINWDLICDDCNMPRNSHMCMIGYDGITFGKAMNIDKENHKHFDINIYSDRYKTTELVTLYFYLEDEIYTWRNNYDVQELFNTLHPDHWCEYKNKYEMYNCGIYPVNKTVLNKIRKLDNDFANRYNGETDNIFYSANW